jgi:hypothetical protein
MMLSIVYALHLIIIADTQEAGGRFQYKPVQGKDLLTLLQSGQIRALDPIKGPEQAEFFFPDGRYIRYSKGVPPFTSRYRIDGADVCVDRLPWCRRVLNSKQRYYWDYSSWGRKDLVEIDTSFGR